MCWTFCTNKWATISHLPQRKCNSTKYSECLTFLASTSWCLNMSYLNVATFKMPWSKVSWQTTKSSLHLSKTNSITQTKMAEPISKSKTSIPRKATAVSAATARTASRTVNPYWIWSTISASSWTSAARGRWWAWASWILVRCSISSMNCCRNSSPQYLRSDFSSSVVSSRSRNTHRSTKVKFLGPTSFIRSPISLSSIQNVDSTKSKPKHHKILKMGWNSTTYRTNA